MHRNNHLSTPGALFVVAIMGVLGAMVTFVAGVQEWIFPPPPRPQSVMPLPHHIPKYPGGVSLRFAMVNDALTERFAKHGKAYYTERNRLVRKELDDLKALGKPSENLNDKYFALLDDLGAGIEALGDHDLAVRVLRDKLKEQQELGYQGRQLYTTYANLGTFLIHGNFSKARSGDSAAKELLREGLNFIHKSIEVNPQAHFGREIWQALAVEFMLAAIENPQLLLQFDMIGNSLQAQIDPSEKQCFTDAPARWGTQAPWWFHVRVVDEFLRKEEENRMKAEDQAILIGYRAYITLAGAEGNWNQAITTSNRKPVPFDEPTLGIIGMWRLGGGANPHFALTLGEIMMRVGQRYLAWTAYERAGEMADRYWPDPKIQEKFVEHCRHRQFDIEEQLPSENWKERRQQFQDELAFGLRYQSAYQEYEAKRIKEGASIDDPHFYDAFHAEHGSVASPVGPEDKFIVADARKPERSFSLLAMVVFAGPFAFVTACFLRLTISRTKQ